LVVSQSTHDLYGSKAKEEEEEEEEEEEDPSTTPGDVSM
jgi:hypothetical protein